MEGAREESVQRPFVFRSRTSALSKAPPGVVFDVISDLQAHVVWSGERAADDDFKLLSLDAPNGKAVVGTTFTSTGANFNGTFHDSSIVAEVTPPKRFVIETDARLHRRRGRRWEVHFQHCYDITPDGDGSKITYTETITRLNYVPYWLQWWLRPIMKVLINAADRKQLRNLARLAEERAGF